MQKDKKWLFLLDTISCEIYTILKEILIEHMQSLDLPLFSTLDSEYNTSSLIKETATTQTQPIRLLEPLEDALKGIFPQSEEENAVNKTRRILGEKAKTLSDEQIHCIATEFQFLIITWLDEFEKDIFNGMTLKEVLNEK